VTPTQVLFSDLLHVLSVVDLGWGSLPLTGGSRGASRKGGDSFNNRVTPEGRGQTPPCTYGTDLNSNQLKTPPFACSFTAALTMATAAAPLMAPVAQMMIVPRYDIGTLSPKLLCAQARARDSLACRVARARRATRGAWRALVRCFSWVPD